MEAITIVDGSGTTMSAPVASSNFSDWPAEFGWVHQTTVLSKIDLVNTRPLYTESDGVVSVTSASVPKFVPNPSKRLNRVPRA